MDSIIQGHILYISSRHCETSESNIEHGRYYVFLVRSKMRGRSIHKYLCVCLGMVIEPVVQFKCYFLFAKNILYKANTNGKRKAYNYTSQRSEATYCSGGYLPCLEWETTSISLYMNYIYICVRNEWDRDNVKQHLVMSVLELANKTVGFLISILDRIASIHTYVYENCKWKLNSWPICWGWIWAQKGSKSYISMQKFRKWKKKLTYLCMQI